MKKVLIRSTYCLLCHTTRLVVSLFLFSADAALDKLLLEFALPNLNHVIAIEPDREFNKQIDEAFTGFQNRQIKVCRHLKQL